MFDLSWPETFLVLIIALLVIGPEQLPAVIKAFRKGVQKIRSFGKEITDGIVNMEEISDLKSETDKLNRQINTIVDLDGNEQAAYDISDILPVKSTSQKPKRKKTSNS